MAAGDLVELDAQPVADDPSLKVPREQPVLARSKDSRRDIRPGLGRPRLGKHPAAWLAVEAGSITRDVRGHVVEEALLKGLLAPFAHWPVALEQVGHGLGVARVRPPLAGVLAGRGDH